MTSLQTAVLATGSVLDFLLQRRSVKPVLMGAPGPSASELDDILTAAARVPDHKKLVPWRFIVFEGSARAAFGDALAAACQAEEKEPPSAARLETERRRLLDAPLVVCVVSRTTATAGAPEWEQVLSAGAACFNLCLAANALGYASNWLTGWYSYSPAIRAHLTLAGNERIAGFIYIGSAKEKPTDRERPDLAAIVTRYGA
jgi:nitroreductase